MSLLKEFREFIMKGNVLDLAIAVIIGGAFGKIVTSLVNDIIMPPIGLLLGKVDFKQLKFVLQGGKEAIMNGTQIMSPAVSEVSLNYGSFIQSNTNIADRNGVCSVDRSRSHWNSTCRNSSFQRTG